MSGAASGTARGHTQVSTAGSARPRIGVLALQGDVSEHLRMLAGCGAQPIRVRRPEELVAVDGLVLPGGESTTMVKLAATFELLEPLRKHVEAGLPTFGTCAGMILLADRILDGLPGQQTIGGLDITVRRNAFGRQVDSFEAPLDLSGWAQRLDAVFIRAPWVEQAAASVDVLARIPARDGNGRQVEEAAVGRIVAVRSGQLMATSFHPEMTGDHRLHAMFCDLVRHRLRQDG